MKKVNKSKNTVARTLKNPHKHSHLGHYLASECIALVFDLVFLWFLTTHLHMNYLIAAAIAYVIAITIHYHTTRYHIFRGSIRSKYPAMAYFLAVGVGGLVIALFMLNFLVDFGFNYLSARAAAAIAVIPATYALNKYVTFVMPHTLPNEKDLYCNIPEAHGD